MNLADFVYNLLALEGDKSKPSAKINFFTSSFLSPVGLTRELFKRLLTPGNKFTKVNKQPKSVGGHKLWNLNDLFVALVLLSYLLLCDQKVFEGTERFVVVKKILWYQKTIFLGLGLCIPVPVGLLVKHQHRVLDLKWKKIFNKTFRCLEANIQVVGGQPLYIALIICLIILDVLT